MITIALNMIAKNEGPRIGAALESAAKVCDELIVVDTGSTDGTPAVAASHGATVLHFDWCDDYAAARNHALDQTTADWILVLDADDVFDDEAAEEIQRLRINLSDDIDGVLMNYLYEHDGDRCTQQFLIQRLIRRASGLRWVEPVHEYIPFPDATRVLLRPDINVTHRPDGKDRSDRTMQLRILERAIAAREPSPRTWYNYGNELAFVGRHEEALNAYWTSRLTRRGPRDGDAYAALVKMAHCYLAIDDAPAARERALHAIDDDPSRAEAYAFLGELEYQAGEYERAIPLFAAAVCCTPPIEGMVHRELYGWLSHERLAICYQRIGKAEFARAHHIESLADRPDVNRMRKRIANHLTRAE